MMQPDGQAGDGTTAFDERRRSQVRRAPSRRRTREDPFGVGN
ncbi:hypothetical protein [Halopelagius fulvigenes]|uniref:Uncharacterized protein n=1 Tax=Halopelagius fulvigenes TaxID=1198324 RepID=A0ABD5TZ08_9EURY